jgi:hypothetical protein
MLPMSAFQQAVADDISKADLECLCRQLSKNSLSDQNSRLAALSFVGLTDVKFGANSVTVFRLCVALYDRLSAKRPVDLIETLFTVSETRYRTAASAFALS